MVGGKGTEKNDSLINMNFALQRSGGGKGEGTDNFMKGEEIDVAF